MQFDPIVRAAHPFMTETHFSHRGYSTLEPEKFERVSALTQNKINAMFGDDIGQDVKRLAFHACAVEIKTTSNPGSVNFPLNSLIDGVSKIYLNDITKFTQRGGAAFVELKLLGLPFKTDNS